MIHMGRLIHILGGLIIVDILITGIAVGFMGAVELNPLFGLVGFGWAMLIKIIASVTGVYILYHCAPSAPSVARPAMTFLIAVYTIAVISNTYQFTRVFT